MLALATRPVYVTCYHARAEQRTTRLGALQTAAERIGLQWGGIEAGKVTVYIGDGKIIRRISAIENSVHQWAAQFDQGDMRWYDWLFVTTNYDQAQRMVVYLQRLIARGAKLDQEDRNHLKWLKRTGQWPELTAN